MSNSVCLLGFALTAAPLGQNAESGPANAARDHLEGGVTPMNAVGQNVAN